MAGAATPDTFGQPSQTGGAWQRVAQVVVTFCGIMFIPVVTAIVLDSLARGRAGASRPAERGRARPRRASFGLGNVGTRVATLIAPGSASRWSASSATPTARRASRRPAVWRSRSSSARRRSRTSCGAPACTPAAAVLALTGDDAGTSRAALEARALGPDVRVVRGSSTTTSPPRSTARSRTRPSRSVSYLAAPAFAAALMGREVLGTLSVYRHVVLIAEFVAEEGSDLVGRTLHEIEVHGEVRVIAVCSRTAKTTSGARTTVGASTPGTST